jgi:hypothetical protein
MQTPDDLDPYRAPRSETTQAEGTLAGAGQPLPWEPLDSFQFAFKQLRAYPMAILIAFVAILCSSVLGMMGAVAQALLNASGEREKILLGWVVYTLAIVVNTPIAAWMAVGQARCALAMLRGRRPEISEVFGTKGALSGIGAQLLYSLVSILIGGLCLGPGLVVLFQDDASPVGLVLMLVGLLPFVLFALVTAVRFNLMNLVAADRAPGVFETLGQSWKLTSGVFWLFVLFLLLAAATYIVAWIGGMLLCCIGVIATMPAGVMLMQLAAADAYLKRTGERPVGIA